MGLFDRRDPTLCSNWELETVHLSCCQKMDFSSNPLQSFRPHVYKSFRGVQQDHGSVLRGCWPACLTDQIAVSAAFTWPVTMDCFVLSLLQQHKLPFVWSIIRQRNTKIVKLFVCLCACACLFVRVLDVVCLCVCVCVCACARTCT